MEYFDFLWNGVLFEMAQEIYEDADKRHWSDIEFDSDGVINYDGKEYIIDIDDFTRTTQDTIRQLAFKEYSE